MFSYKNSLIVVILTFFIVSCADDNPTRTETLGWSVQKLYFEASSALQNKSWSRAIKLYEILESTYPYGIYSQQGMLDLAYAHYQNDEADIAITTINQFIDTYPTNSNMDYALYFKGYINYKNDNGLLSRFTHQDLSERDPKSLKDSYEAFSQLVSKYPNSRFAPDARDKMDRLVAALARGELYRARYYMEINADLAAISRSQNIINDYSNTPFVEEALAMQVVAYSRLNQPVLSEKTREVLALNFPNSIYLKNMWTYQDLSWYAFWRS